MSAILNVAIARRLVFRLILDQLIDDARKYTLKPFQVPVTVFEQSACGMDSLYMFESEEKAQPEIILASDTGVATAGTREGSRSRTGATENLVLSWRACRSAVSRISKSPVVDA